MTQSVRCRTRCWLPTASVLLASAMSVTSARAVGAVGPDWSSHAAQPDGQFAPARATLIVDDLDDWENIPYNCGFAPSPLPTGIGFFKGGLTQNWNDGRVPADGVQNIWNGHAYWTGARSIWIDQDTNNWALWAPSLPEDGLYRVDVFIPRMGTGERLDTRRATYRIQTDTDHEWGNEHEFTINQLQKASAGGGWVTLDELRFSNTSLPGGCAGGPSVLLTDVSSDASSAITVDAVRFVPVDAEPSAAEVWIDGGCNQTFAGGERFTVKYRANRDDLYQLIHCTEEGSVDCGFVMQQSGVAGVTYEHTAYANASHRLGYFYLRLPGIGLESPVCRYSVARVPTATPAPSPTPRPTDPPSPTLPPPTDTPSNLVIRRTWWNDGGNPHAFQGNRLHVQVENVGRSWYESGTGQYRLLVTTAVDGLDDALVLHFASKPADPDTWLSPQALSDVAPGGEVTLTADNIWFTSGGSGGFYSVQLELGSPDSSAQDNGSGVQNLTVDGIPLNAALRCYGAITYLVVGAPLSKGLQQFLKPSVNPVRVTREVLNYLRDVAPCIKANDTECILENTPYLFSSFEPNSVLDAVHALMDMLFGVVEDIGGCLVDAVRVGLELIGRLHEQGLAGDAAGVTGDAFVALRDDLGRAVGYLDGKVVTEVPGSSVYVGEAIMAFSSQVASELLVEASDTRGSATLAATVRRHGLSTYIEYPPLSMTEGLRGQAQLQGSYLLQVDSNGDGRTDFVVEPRIVRRLGGRSVYLPQVAHSAVLRDEGVRPEIPTTTRPTPLPPTQVLSPSATPVVC